MNHLFTNDIICRKNGYTDMLKELRTCVEANNQIVAHILKDVENVFENSKHKNKGKSKIIVFSAEDLFFPFCKIFYFSPIPSLFP